MKTYKSTQGNKVEPHCRGLKRVVDKEKCNKKKMHMGTIQPILLINKLLTLLCNKNKMHMGTLQPILLINNLLTLVYFLYYKVKSLHNMGVILWLFAIAITLGTWVTLGYCIATMG